MCTDPSRCLAEHPGVPLSILTFLTVAAVAYGILGRHGYGRTLALGGVAPAGAAVIVGSLAVPTFYAVALGAAVALALSVLGGRNTAGLERGPLPPGVGLLLLLLGWAVVVTLVAPILFDGLTTLLPAAGPTRLTAGNLSTSNIAQLGYLALGVCVVVFVARSRRAGPELIGLVVGGIVLLSAWRYLNQIAGVPFPEDVLDNSPRLAYIETAPGGVERFRGILSEPASLAGFCLMGASYMIARAGDVSGWRRIGAFSVATIAIYLGSISTSATFVVAGVAMVGIAAATFTVRMLLQWAAVRPLVIVVACVLALVALWVLPVVTAFVDTTIADKVGSSSYDERSGADAFSYGIFLDTFGFGVGVGSNRASSFLPGLLSTVGLVGMLLFSAAVFLLIRRGWAVREYRPVVWALVTLLVVKVIAGPDLSDTSGIMWISLGLLARAAMIAQRTRCSPVSLPEPVPAGMGALPTVRFPAVPRRPGHP
jgi:hypothetical protein